MAVILPISEAEVSAGVKAHLGLAERVQRAVESGYGCSCTLGVSKACSTLDALPGLWRDTVRALELGIALNGRSTVISVESLGVMGLMLEHIPAKSLESTCYRVLGVLLENDTHKGTDFCRTLRTYLERDCRFVEAARLLYIHENTLRHRVKRIEKMLNLDLSDPYARANLLICLKLANMGFVCHNKGPMAAP